MFWALGRWWRIAAGQHSRHRHMDHFDLFKHFLFFWWHCGTCLHIYLCMWFIFHVGNLHRHILSTVYIKTPVNGLQTTNLSCNNYTTSISLHMTTSLLNFTMLVNIKCRMKYLLKMCTISLIPGTQYVHVINRVLIYMFTPYTTLVKCTPITPLCTLFTGNSSTHRSHVNMIDLPQNDIYKC